MLGWLALVGGVAMVVVGFALLLGAVAILGTGARTDMFSSQLSISVWRVIVGGAGCLGLAIGLASRPHLVRGARAVLRSDRRSHILYLRQFSDDETPYVQPDRTRIAWWSNVLRRSYEERLAAALRTVGPVVAIGWPGDLLPDLGAARLYVSDDDWQGEVRTLVETAALTLLHTGETAGISWEIAELVARHQPLSVILVLPMEWASPDRVDTRRYGEFLRLNGSVFPKPLPRDPGAAQFMMFDEGWTPILIEPVRATLAALAAPSTNPATRVRDRALRELCRMFLRVNAPFWLRYWGLTLGALAAAFSITIAVALYAGSVGRFIEETTLFGLYPSQADVLAEAEPRLARHIATLAALEPQLRPETGDATGSVRLEPSPAYRFRGRHPSNTDIIMLSELPLLATGKRTPYGAFDLTLGRSLRLVLQWAAPDSDNPIWPPLTARAGETFRAMVAEAAALRYVVVAAPGRLDLSLVPDAAGDWMALLPIRLSVVDLGRGLVAASGDIILTVRLSAQEMDPEEVDPTLRELLRGALPETETEIRTRREKHARARLWTTAQSDVPKALAELTGGVFKATNY